MGVVLTVFIIVVVLVHIGLDTVMEEFGKLINMIFRRNKQDF